MSKKADPKPDWTYAVPGTDIPPFPLIQSRLGNETNGLDRPIPPDVYPEIDTDLARDNLENDIPAADLEDL